MMRRAEVDFGKALRVWDGFGINYVETAQTRDYEADPQEYGGFGTLSEDDRQSIIDMVFGDDGLRPGVLKMFLDPWHQASEGAELDHATTTRWLRYFAREGLRRTRAAGRDLRIVTTLYGPPAWMTLQGFMRGRDLDPSKKAALAQYMISWIRFLREEEGLPVKFLSLHNEGEDWTRWPEDGGTGDAPSHDYNMYWPPEQVVDFLKFMRPMMDGQGLADVGITPGECTNWHRFSDWGYADAISGDDAALANLGLITSHGFYAPGLGRWLGDWRSTGTDLLREKRPELHAWVTSTSWSKMNAAFIMEMWHNIYCAKVNAIIPWAAIQRSDKWVGGDPNPGTAFRLDGKGGYTVEPGYHYYRQVCRVGQPGMSVAWTLSNDSEVGLIAFASNGTGNPDALIVVNASGAAKPMDVRVMGAAGTRFTAFRTSPSENGVPIGTFEAVDGIIGYTAPPDSVTTLECMS